MAIMNIEQRRNFELIKAMHTVVMYLNDEEAIEPWFYAYPDGADDEELMEMAGDMESMDFLCANFGRRIAQGAENGWFTQPYSEFEETIGEKHLYGAKKGD